MATFAKLDENNIVLNVIRVSDENARTEAKGIAYLEKLTNHANWKQTSFNTHRNVHRLGGIPFRKNGASKGYTYDSNLNAFYRPKEFPSWVWNSEVCDWDPPCGWPPTDDGKAYKWNESIANYEVETVDAEGNYSWQPWVK